MKTNIFLINRGDRPHRLINSLQELRKVDMSHLVTRVEATTPAEAKSQMFQHFTEKAITNIRQGGNHKVVIPTWGAAACALSHRKCWIQASLAPYDYSLILEDDIEILDRDKFRFAYHRAVASLETIGSKKKQKPLIWLLGSKTRETFRCDDPEVEKIYGAFIGLQSYLINRTAAQLLASLCCMFTYQVDVQIGLLIRDYLYNQHVLEGLSIYNTKRAGIIQSKKFSSDIQPLKISPVIICKISHDRLNLFLANKIFAYLGPSDIERCREVSIDDNIEYLYGDYDILSGGGLSLEDQIVWDELY